jgi:hypothetical protein
MDTLLAQLPNDIFKVHIFNSNVCSICVPYKYVDMEIIIFLNTSIQLNQIIELAKKFLDIESIDYFLENSYHLYITGKVVDSVFKKSKLCAFNIISKIDKIECSFSQTSQEKILK